MIDHLMEDGRVVVKFDSGESHRYGGASLQKISFEAAQEEHAQQF